MSKHNQSQAPQSFGTIQASLAPQAEVAPTASPADAPVTDAEVARVADAILNAAPMGTPPSPTSAVPSIAPLYTPKPDPRYLVVKVSDDDGNALTTFDAFPKTFSSGSKGYWDGGKVTINGVRYQAQVQFVKIHSK